MFSRAAVSSTSNVSRVATSGAMARRVARRPGQSWQRFQSTSSQQTTGSFASHLAAGVAGGGVVILAGYGYYHTSGLKAAVQTSKEVKAYLQSTKDSVIEKTRQAAKNPSQVLDSLKSITKSYVGFIPGSSSYVDAAFEQIEELREQHGDETNKVLQEISDEISKAVSEGKADISTASKVFESLRNGLSKLQELGTKVGGDALAKSPRTKELLEGGFGSLVSLAGKGKDESRKAFDAINDRLQAIESFQKKFEKNGDLSGMLDGGAESFKKVIGSLPMGGDLLKKAPHLQDILDLAEKRGDQAKELLEETYQDVTKILEEKGKKAQELGKKIASDAKKS